MTVHRPSTPILHYPPAAAPPRLRHVLIGLTILGFVAFLAGIIVGEGQRAWQIYFVNFLFWSGIAQGGVVVAGVYGITNARWGDQFRRIGEGMVVFLPVSLLLYAVLVMGGGMLFPWLHGDTGGKEVWLSGWFLFGRDGIAFLFLAWLSGKFVAASLRPDLGLLPPRTDRSFTTWLHRRITNGWTSWDEEEILRRGRLARLTPALLISFAVLYSLIGFDLVMALDPHWVSTLYGWLFFLHAFYASLVAIAILAIVSRKWLKTEGAYSVSQWHDMGRFVFGFCLLSGGFFWSQYLVIWYGNLPSETSYLIKRFYSAPWEPLMWVYIILAYLFPLAVFLSRRVKEVPGALLTITSLILLALFLERFIAVVPFVWTAATIPFGIGEILVTAGFAASFVLCWMWFAARVPIIPASAGTVTSHH